MWKCPKCKTQNSLRHQKCAGCGVYFFYDPDAELELPPWMPIMATVLFLLTLFVIVLAIYKSCGHVNVASFERTQPK